MKRNLLLLFLSLAFLMPVKLHADTMYAVQSNDTLTFHYSSGTFVFPMGDYEHTYYHVDDEYIVKYGNVHLPEWREAGIAHVVFSSSFADARPTSTACWFYQCENLVSVDSIMNLNTDAVTNMSSMFFQCSSLTSLDLSGLNTSNVTNMKSMFNGCTKLSSLNISDFDTSKVRDMSCMFQSNFELTSIDVSCFNTSLVESMECMFSGCKQLKEINLSGFETKNVESMSWMFHGCSSIDSLYLGSFELTSLTASKSMFYDCEKLKTIVVSDKWIFDPYITCQYMFTGCNSLIGGQGTSYQSLSIMHDDGFYAHIDGGPSNPGLLTADTMGQLDDNTGETRAYCVLKDGILTFYYDNKVNSRQGKKFPVEKTYDSKVFPKWCFVRREIKKVVFDNSFSAFHPTSTARWFYDSANLTEVSGTNNLNTSQVTSMSEMFRFNSSLKSIDLSSWDTSQVTDMGCLFCLCTSLSDINISNFDTSKVKGMYHMFHACPLTTLDLRSFDTSNVTDMVWMFIDSSVETIYVSDKWNTDKVESSIMMFDGCTRLVGGKGTKYDRKHIDHEYACIDGGMCAPGYLTGDSESAAAEPYAVLDDEGTLTFYYDGNKNCREGIVFDASKYDPDWRDRLDITHADFDASFAEYRPKATYQWFRRLMNLESISNIQYLNTEQVANMQEMFYFCEKLQTLDVSHFKTSNVTNMGDMFANCTSLKELDVSNFDTSNVTNMMGMFWFCQNLQTLDVSHFNTSKVKRMDGMFRECEHLQLLDVSNFDTSNVTNMSQMFNYCSSITEIDVRNFKTSNVTDMSGMFSSCKSLTELNVKNFNTSKVTNISSMFSSCQSLTELDIRNFNTSKVTNMGYLFYGCDLLTKLYLNSFDTSNVTNMSQMFDYCSSITEIDLSNFKTLNVTDMTGMFSYCTNLTTIYVSNHWSTDGLSYPTGMFYNNDKLVGEKGTRFADHLNDYTSSSYARIDGGPDSPGYFTYKEYVIPTSINAIPEESGKAQDEVWYNLQGVRIDNPAKGIYILNGKKVVRK